MSTYCRVQAAVWLYNRWLMDEKHRLTISSTSSFLMVTLANSFSLEAGINRLEHDAFPAGKTTTTLPSQVSQHDWGSKCESVPGDVHALTSLAWLSVLATFCLQSLTWPERENLVNCIYIVFTTRENSTPTCDQLISQRLGLTVDVIRGQLRTQIFTSIHVSKVRLQPRAAVPGHTDPHNLVMVMVRVTTQKPRVKPTAAEFMWTDGKIHHPAGVGGRSVDSRFRPTMS